jgi:hypothetical protein
MIESGEDVRSGGYRRLGLEEAEGMGYVEDRAAAYRIVIRVKKEEGTKGVSA